MMFRYRDEEPEPHRTRRMQLLAKYPELKSLYGYSYLTSAVMLGIVAVQLGAAYYAAKWPLWLFVLAAYFVGGTLNHWAAMGIHEAAHNLVARSKTGNRIMALIANIPNLLPGAMSFRRYHLKHHSHLGISPEDNDLAMGFEIKWVGRSAWRKLVWLVFYFFFATLARGFLKKLDRWEVINFIFIVVTDIALFYCVGWMGLAYLGLSTVMGFGPHPAAGHFIHEHYIWEKGQETYSYYGPLNWVTFNVGYHNEHHDLMGIPGWKLPRVRAIAREFYQGLSHSSWTKVMLHFVMNPELGHDSRITRPRAALSRRQTKSE